MTTTSEARKRGGCLTTFLVLMLIANLLAGLFYLFAGSRLAAGPVSLPAWTIVLLGLASIANFIFVLAIWNWKKWGLYGCAGSSLVVFVINAMSLGAIAGLLGLVGLVILVLLVRPAWRAMEGDPATDWVLASRKRTAVLVVVLAGLVAVGGIAAYLAHGTGASNRAEAFRAAEAIDLQGTLEEQKGNLDQAIADYSKAIDLDPQDGPLWYDHRGSAYAKTDHPDMALADFDKAIELDPTFYASYDYRGSYYAEIGNLDQAVADYTKAIQVAPKSGEAYYDRAAVYQREHQNAQALADYQTYLQLEPNSYIRDQVQQQISLLKQ